MATFGLVHGSMHGGWCWRDLRPELERRGHAVVAPDLPCDDPAAGLAEYASVLVEALGEARDVVLVGHSLGGRSLPLVALERPVRGLIFLCCVPVDGPQRRPRERLRMITSEFAQAPVTRRADGCRLLEPAHARRLFYHDCSPEDADWAVSQLRPQAPGPIDDRSPLPAWPEVPCQVLLTRDDRVIDLQGALAQTRERRPALEPSLLEGSHSPFLSRPAELAHALCGLEAQLSSAQQRRS